jgi:hypothetical protein
MGRLGFNPFASIFAETGVNGAIKVVQDDKKAERIAKKRAKNKARRRKHYLPFVLQAYNGSAWKVVYDKGDLVISNRHPSKRNLDFVRVMQKEGFLNEMKIQVFGRGEVSKSKLYKTPIRWRRIDMVSIGGAS